MNTMFCIFILILVLPWNLNANVTLSPSTHQEITSKDYEPPTSGKGFTISQGMYTIESRPDGVSISKDTPVYVTDIIKSHEEHETTLVRTSTGESQSSPNFSSVLPLGKQTHNILDYNQNTRAVKSSTEQTTMYTIESRTDSVSISKDIPVYVTDIIKSHEEHETTLVRTSTGESQSSPNFSSVLPLGKQTHNILDYNQNTRVVKSSSEQTTTMPEVSTIKAKHKIDTSQQTMDLSTKSLKEVIIYETPEVTRLEKQITMTKAQQTFIQETSDPKPANVTSPPNTENRTNSNGKFDPSTGQPNGTALTITSATRTTLPDTTNLTKTTGTTTQVRVQNTTTVKATSDKTTVATTTREKTVDKNNFTSTQQINDYQKSTATTQSVKTQNTKAMPPPKKVTSKQENKTQTKKANSAGRIVATLIGIILVLMIIAIVAIFSRQHQMKKKQKEDPDWAGPSPFIEGDIQTNQPSLEDGLLRPESKRISFYSFLPQRLSKRLSIVRETDEVFLEDIPANTTFRQSEQKIKNNGISVVDQTQKSDTNCQSPAVEESLNTISETTNTDATPANNVNIQETPKSIDASPSLQSETLQPSFEEVDLRGSPEGNTDITKDIPPPPPPPPPPQSDQ